jgi:multidrug efflux pump subunit AcrA (membrane-fusion protein)
MNNMRFIKISFFLLLTASCAQRNDEQIIEEEAEIVSPVTVTTISQDSMTEYLDLNATSGYLKKSVIKSNVNGYVKTIKASLGQFVNAGQILFTLRTKESENIGNAVNALDSSFKFSGIINVKAASSGYIAEVDHQIGDYVQDGEQLAVTNDLKSFVFVMNLPYELRPYVLGKKEVLLKMPDGRSLNGSISYVTPIVDSASQTQDVFISVPDKNIPANVVAKVRIEKAFKPKTVSLPKSAVLSDETQSTFWVMKLLDSNTAVKVPITKGLETTDRVEVISPKFSSLDQFILTGNFGLPDTAKIKIVQR